MGTRREMREGRAAEAARSARRRKYVRLGTGVLVIMVVLAAVWFVVNGAFTHHQMVDAPQEMQEHYAQMIPGEIRFDQVIEAVQPEEIPVVDEHAITAALRFIVRGANNPELQTEEDKLIIELARRYMAGTETFRFDFGDVPSAEEGLTRMAYSCELDHYLVGPGLRATIPLLALSVYHELRHKLECVSDTGGSADDRVPTELDCATELPAYAAQVRFYAALVSAKRIPERLSADGSDLGVLRQSSEAYFVIDKRAFCAWLDKQRTSRGRHDEGLFTIREVR